MKTTGRLLICALFLIGSGGSVAAEDPAPACRRIEGDAVKDMLVAASVSGKRVGDRLELTVTPGALATKGLRVYSEPSHTLVFVAVRGGFRQSPEGRSWLARLAAESPAALALYDRPGTEIGAIVAAPPAGDTAISVWLNGAWPNGEERELQVSETSVAQDQFRFKTGFKNTPTAFLTYNHCCSSSTCGEMCSECPTNRFTCCLGNWPCCCALYCGLAPCPGPCTFESCL